MSRIEYHPDTRAEAFAALEWYLNRNLKIAESFRAELENAEFQATQFPDRWAKYLHGTRYYR